MLVSLRLQFLDTGDLVTGGAIIASDFRLDDDYWSNFIRNTKIWSLPKAWEPFSTFGFPVRDPSMPELILNGIFHHFPNELRDSITMRGK